MPLCCSLKARIRDVEELETALNSLESVLSRQGGFEFKRTAVTTISLVNIWSNICRIGMKSTLIDCFESEPITSPHRFGKLDNVILAPHSIAWTNELFRDIGKTACSGILDLSLGKRPKGVVNPEVFENPKFNAKWAKFVA